MNFEALLPEVPPVMRGALIDVCDTMEMAMRWFEDRKVTYAASDLIRVAEMVLQREAAKLAEGLD